jgi:hypothetical protein
MTPQRITFPRQRFSAETISHTVWLYHVFSLSLRDVELILAERGVIVTHERLRPWCAKFGADFARRLHRRRPRPGDTSGRPSSRAPTSFASVAHLSRCRDDTAATLMPGILA